MSDTRLPDEAEVQLPTNLRALDDRGALEIDIRSTVDARQVAGEYGVQAVAWRQRKDPRGDLVTVTVWDPETTLQMQMAFTPYTARRDLIKLEARRMAKIVANPVGPEAIGYYGAIAMRAAHEAISEETWDRQFYNYPKPVEYARQEEQNDQTE